MAFNSCRQSGSHHGRRALASFPFMVASLCLAAATHYCVSLYGVVHWKVAGPATHLSGSVLELQLRQSAEEGQGVADRMALERMQDETRKLRDGVMSLMRKTGIYSRTGWLSLAFAVVTFFGRPRWAGWIALPPALYAVFLSCIIM